MDRIGRHVVYTLVAIFGLSASGIASAQEFPTRPVTLVAPYAPGGVTDLAVRVLAEGMSQSLPQGVIVENKPGAGTAIAARDVLRAPADGYRLMVATASTLSINPFLDKKIGYEAKNFEPITLIIKVPMLFVAAKGLPVTNVRSLIDYAKQKPPGTLSYGSTGIGTTTHLAAELFSQAAGIKLNHIPYKGTAPAQADVLSGNLQLYVDGLTGTLLQLHKADRVHAIATFSDRREESLPDVPTIAESGYPNVQVYTWVALVAKSGTPAAITSSLNASAVRALRLQSTQDRFMQNGLRAAPSTQRELGDLIDRDSTMWKAVIDRLGISLSLD